MIGDGERRSELTRLRWKVQRLRDDRLFRILKPHQHQGALVPQPLCPVPTRL